MSEACGFQNCERLVVKDCPWQMCEPCASHAYEIEDSSRFIDDYAECTCGHYYDAHPCNRECGCSR